MTGGPTVAKAGRARAGARPVVNTAGDRTGFAPMLTSIPQAAGSLPNAALESAVLPPSTGPGGPVAERPAAGGASDPATSNAPGAAPAIQLGQAVASLHVGTSGTSHVVVRLDPVELGQVQVRITRGHDGAVGVSVAVERPETLRTLQADLTHLHQMLDRAGLPEARTLVLHLAPQEPSAGLQAGAGGQQGSLQQGGGFDQGGGNRQERSQAMAGPASPATADQARGSDTPQPNRWLRAGINITA